MKRLIAVMLIAACGVEARPEPEQRCVPGDVEECPCAGETAPGAQTCNDEGTAFGTCACCTPGARRSCTCQSAGKVGQQDCSAEGAWGNCYNCQ